MDPRAASEKRGRPSRAAGWTLAEGTQEARGSGGTCRVTMSGTWALSSSGRVTELCTGPEKWAQVEAPDGLGKRSIGQKQSRPQGIGQLASVSRSLENHHVQSFQGTPAACTSGWTIF